MSHGKKTNIQICAAVALTTAWLASLGACSTGLPPNRNSANTDSPSLDHRGNQSDGSNTGAVTASSTSMDVNRASSAESFSLVAVGDIIHPNRYRWTPTFKKLGRKMYAPTRSIIQGADLAFANLEGAFTRRRPILQKKFAFTAIPEDLDHILWTGFNVFSLANNHSADAGLPGLKDSIGLMEAKKEAGLGRPPFVWTGAGRNRAEARRIVYFTVPGKNVRVAFLAYSTVVGPYDNTWSLKRAIGEVTAARNTGVDLVIVSIHAGREYEHIPGRAYIRNYRSIIRAGADIILGHHPHVAQGFERYRHGVIFYSLGNYSMGSVQMRNLKKNAKMFSLIARVFYSKHDSKSEEGTTPTSCLTINRVEAIPIFVDWNLGMSINGNYYKPKRFITEPAQGAVAAYINKYLIAWSKKIYANASTYEIKDELVIVHPRPTLTPGLATRPKKNYRCPPQWGP